MRYALLSLLPAALCAGLLLIPPANAQTTDEPPGLPDGADVQARGPVHEAFGEPTGNQAAPGPLVSKQPPKNIDEAPPEEKPEGDNITWIPGYWAWDEERSDFLWVSGFWRAVPPGRSWVPGHWQQAADGNRWVAGYWGVADSEETEYLPPPPATIEHGPSIPAPGENYTYVPGCWIYRNRYVWRPGYWVGYRPGWVWVPSCYRWTPCGYSFVSGYWDAPLLERGLLFAPVCFTRPVYLRPGFVYRPSYCIQPDFLCGALFVRNGCSSYYFGDYFGASYRRNYVSWCDFRFGGGRGFDINFSYYRCSYSRHTDWEVNLRRLYVARYQGHVARPPRSLHQQRRAINHIHANKTTNVTVHKNINITNVQNVSVLAPVNKVRNVQVTALSSLTNAKASPAVHRQMRLQRVPRTRLEEEKKSITRYREMARERRTTEAKMVGKAPKAPTAAPVKVRRALPHGTPPGWVHRNTKPPEHPQKETRRINPVNPVKPVKPINKPVQPVKPVTVPHAESKGTIRPPSPAPKPMITPPPEVKKHRPHVHPGKQPGRQTPAKPNKKAKKGNSPSRRSRAIPQRKPGRRSQGR